MTWANGWIKDQVRSYNTNGLVFYQPASKEKGKWVTMKSSGQGFLVETGTYEGAFGFDPNDIVESCFSSISSMKFDTLKLAIQFIEENLGFRPFLGEEKKNEVDA